MESSNIILYMNLICICFRYLLCYLGHFSSPSLNTVMYFSHRFPLTSHIRGNLLSCKMALLRPSTDIQYVGIHNYKLDWSSQNTIDGHDYWYIISWPAKYIFIWTLGLQMQLFAQQLACHTQVCTLQLACTLNKRVSLKQVMCHTRLLYQSPCVL